MSGVTGEELFDPLDFLRELEAEASQPTSTTTPSSYKRQRHNIAAANPLLAGELPVARYSYRQYLFRNVCNCFLMLCVQKNQQRLRHKRLQLPSLTPQGRKSRRRTFNPKRVKVSGKCVNFVSYFNVRRYGRKTYNVYRLYTFFYFTDVNLLLVTCISRISVLDNAFNLLYLRTIKSARISVGQVAFRACREFKAHC